jgi:hypothetical protein
MYGILYGISPGTREKAWVVGNEAHGAKRLLSPFEV